MSHFDTLIAIDRNPELGNNPMLFSNNINGRRSPAVACWASDHWVASSNPLRGNFVINFASLSPTSAWPSFSLHDVYREKRPKS